MGPHGQGAFADRAALHPQAIDLALDAERWPPLHVEGSLAFTPRLLMPRDGAQIGCRGVRDELSVAQLGRHPRVLATDGQALDLRNVRGLQLVAEGCSCEYLALVISASRCAASPERSYRHIPLPHGDLGHELIAESTRKAV